jgi:hypothetical protein
MSSGVTGAVAVVCVPALAVSVGFGAGEGLMYVDEVGFGLGLLDWGEGVQLSAGVGAPKISGRVDLDLSGGTRVPDPWAVGDVPLPAVAPTLCPAPPSLYPVEFTVWCSLGRMIAAATATMARAPTAASVGFSHSDSCRADGRWWPPGWGAGAARPFLKAEASPVAATRNQRAS